MTSPYGGYNFLYRELLVVTELFTLKIRIPVMEEQVIVFDGECRFCRWSVRRIQRLDSRDQFEYLPRQAQGVEVRFPQLAESDFNTGLRLVDGERIYVGADALYEIYRRMPPFHLLTWFYRAPVLHGVFKMCYGLIARNRHRFGRVTCDTGICDGSRSASDSERVSVAEMDGAIDRK